MVCQRRYSKCNWRVHKFRKIVISPLNISSVEWSEIDTGIEEINYVHFFDGHTLTILDSKQENGNWDIVFAQVTYDNLTSELRSEAIEGFFEKIGTPIEMVSDLNEINDEGIRYWIDRAPNSDKYGYNFKFQSDDDYWKIEQFFSGNYLQTYLESNDITPGLQYMKQKVVFENGNVIGTAYVNGAGKFEVTSMSDIGTNLNPAISRAFVRALSELE